MRPFDNPYRSTASRLVPSIRPLLLAFALFASQGVQAQDIEAFDVRYHVYRGDMHVANSQFSLSRHNDSWIWSMKTAPRSIYRWLTHKKPYAETHTLSRRNDFQLLLEHTGDYPEQPPTQSSWFDHTNQTIYFMHGSDISQMALPENTYNYHSVHLLYPLMREQNRSQMTINFYREGKLNESTLILEKQQPLDPKSPQTMVDRVTQSFAGSAKKMIYSYQPGNLAPLKIEQIKPGKDINVMRRAD